MAEVLHRLRPWLSTLGLLLLWQGLATAGVLDPRTLPAPTTLAVTAAALAADGSLAGALGTSLLRVLAGTALGVGCGLAAGLAAGLSRLAHDVLDRPFQMARTVPFTALAPLLIVWFGLGETPKVLLVALAVAVPTYLSTVGGVRSVDPALVEVARAFRLGRWGTVRAVLLPGALPAVLVGLRLATGVAWVAVIVAEGVNASAGVGFLLTNARTYGRTDVVMVCVVLYALLGLATDLVVRALEARLLGDRDGRAGGGRVGGGPGDRREPPPRHGPPATTPPTRLPGGRMTPHTPSRTPRTAALRPGVLAVLALTLVAACAGPADAPGASGTPAGAELRLGPLATQNTLTLCAGSGELAGALAATGDRLVTTEPFAAFAPAAEALAAGRADMTSAGATGVVAAAAGNPDLVVFAVEHNDNDTQGIVATAASGITDVAGLVGHTVAVNQGGTGEYLLRVALRSVGRTVADVTPVYLAPADAATAFAAGQVDAWATWDQYLVGAEQQDGARLVATAAQIGADNPTVHVVSRAFLEAHPRTVAAAYDALVGCAQRVRDDPRLLVDAYTAAGTPPEVAAAVGATTPPTVEPADAAFADRLDDLAAFAAQEGLTPQPVDVRDLTVDVATLRAPTP